MASMELKTGDFVHYGAHGVCRVCGQETKRVGGQKRVYFTLQPTDNEKLLLYLPADADPEQFRLRRLLSREELISRIREAEATPFPWISDSKLRRERFSNILRNGNVGELYGMLRCIAARQETIGRKLPFSDQEMMQAAQRQLYGEVSCVLAIDESQVHFFIMDLLREPTS